MPRRLNRNVGLLVAGIWFLLRGLSGLIAFNVQGLGLIMAVLALFAGILLLIGR